MEVFGKSEKTLRIKSPPPGIKPILPPQQKLIQKPNPKIKHTEFQQIQQKSKKCQLYYSFSHLSHQYGWLWERAMHWIQLSDIKDEKETASEFSLGINRKYLQYFNSSEQILGNICLTLTSLWLTVSISKENLPWQIESNQISRKQSRIRKKYNYFFHFIFFSSINSIENKSGIMIMFKFLTKIKCRFWGQKPEVDSRFDITFSISLNRWLLKCWQPEWLQKVILPPGHVFLEQFYLYWGEICLILRRNLPNIEEKFSFEEKFAKYWGEVCLMLRRNFPDCAEEFS